MLASDESIKDFQVEANDGHAGKVSWASYAPGESYLVVSHLHHLHEVHHVVPAAAVAKISTSERKVWLRVNRAQVKEAPEHHDPAAPVDHSTFDAFESATATWSFGGDMF
jgi:hypothetical protein